MTDEQTLETIKLLEPALRMFEPSSHSGYDTLEVIFRRDADSIYVIGIKVVPTDVKWADDAKLR
jgi:hypothetical protein